MVAAAHPLAVDAALRMLDRGGSAVDAAIAAQLVLNLVEPQSSGIGGGAFLLFYDAKARAIRAYDGRETAPAQATPQLFLRADGTPMRFHEARVGGRSVGVPGTLRLLEVAHARHGKLPWHSLFEPAIALAEHGFPMSPRLHRVLSELPAVADDAAARRYLFDERGAPRPVGARIVNRELAATLKAVARHGSDAFYTGEIARDMVAAVRGHRNPGKLTLDDLASYRVRDVEALCAPYRAYRLCGMPPSSSGGIAVLQILGELERFDMAAVRPNSTEAVHRVSEAERLAFADRERYAADDRFVDVPVKGLVDRKYLARRSQLIRDERSMGKARAGEPPGAVAYAEAAAGAEAGTSHLVVVDRDGNAVSMTTTIEWGFGSGIMVHGFFLNNELTDFDFVPSVDGRPVANAVAPGKRPRSSMAPFLVFDGTGGTLEAAIGSAGGSFIIGHVAKALIAMIDWNMDVQRAIDLPNFDSRNGATEIEKATALDTVAPALRAMGHTVAAIEMSSGLHGLRRAGGGWDGGADPRREGAARGR